jgi:cell division septation protein DedD
VAYAVQVSAVRSAGSADQAMKVLKTYGYEPRVSRDADGFLRVRVGRFKTKAEAQRLAADIKRKVGGAPFVVEEQ